MMEMLKERVCSAREISQALSIREKEVYEHLPHVEKSLGGSASLICEPARCQDCGFAFKKRRRYTSPGKCPVCRSEFITDPVYGITCEDRRATAEGEQTMTTSKQPDHHNICEFEEDATVPIQHERLKAAIHAVVESCVDERAIDHVGAALIPSTGEIMRILEVLQDILFPGFFGRQELNRSTLEFHLGNEIVNVFELLSAQISRSIRHECRRMDSLCVKCMQMGHEEALHFIERIPDLRDILGKDVQAHYDGDPAAKSLDEIVFCYPGLYAIFVYRVAHELWLREIPLIPRIMTEHAHSRTGIDIHPGATIGSDFFIDHGTGVVIGETTAIGDRVRIYQGVTLGALSVPRESEGGGSLRGRKRHPTIEDDVTIYAQATILGGDTVIGARCIIGGNVWLTSSVPPETTVVIETPRLSFKGDRQKNQRL